MLGVPATAADRRTPPPLLGATIAVRFSRASIASRPSATREPSGRVARLHIRRVRQRPLRLRQLEQFLAEQRHHTVCIGLVPGDEAASDFCAELLAARYLLRLSLNSYSSTSSSAHAICRRSASARQRSSRPHVCIAARAVCHRRVNIRRAWAPAAAHRCAVPFSAPAVQKRGVVARAFRRPHAVAGSRSSTPAIPPSSAATSATVRPIGPAVSCDARDRDDAAAAHQTHGRLETDDAVHRRRTDDAAVRLGADRDRRQARGDRNRRARAGPARIAIEHVRVLRLSAARAPSRRGPRRAEVRPLAQIGPAENDDARVTKAANHEGVGLRDGCRRRRASRRS